MEKLIDETVFLRSFAIIDSPPQGPTLSRYKNRFVIDLNGVDGGYFKDQLMLLVDGNEVTKGDADIEVIIGKVREFLLGYGDE